MKILFDIGHPAHVHLFKNTYSNLRNKGHEVFVTVKDIKSAKNLLDIYGMKYIDLGKKTDTLIGKGLRQLNYDYILYKIIRQNKIDFGISSSITLPHISKITKMKSIVLDDDDDEVEPLFKYFAHPFCTVLMSPDASKGHRKKKQTIFYSGYHELAYLHPKQFTPDVNVLKEAGIIEGEKYFILRFNSFKAHHDIGVEGLSIESKRRLISLLIQHGKVFITSEREIDPEFEQYRIKIDPHKIHSFIYFANMFVGDSQTMTSEAAVLGTPAIRSNSFVGRIAYLEEEEHKYKLTFGFKPNESEQMIEKIESLLSIPNLKEEWGIRRKKMLDDKIDVTSFLLWFIENYPESNKIMKENPGYQNKFK